MDGRRPASRLARFGPGIAIAATGVGAGDLVAASVAGLEFGMTLAWVVALGAILKFALNEGIARWQLVTGQSVLEAVVSRFSAAFTWYLALYFVIWTPAVAAALAAACGIAAHALWPALEPSTWGVLHSLAAGALVLAGGYRLFERAMKGLIALMFVCIVGSLLWIGPDWSAVLAGLVIPSVPHGSILLILSVMGGVGGSVTLLAYGTWIQEKGWSGPGWLGTARLDLTLAYGLTGVFGVAILVLAATLGGAGSAPQTGPALLVGLAGLMADGLGEAGRFVFLGGVWAAVFTSMLGVWHGVPALLADFLRAWGRAPRHAGGGRDSLRLWLVVGIAAVAAAIVPFGRPLWLILTYTVIGSLFMPFLAWALLRLNSQGGPLGSSQGYRIGGRAVLTAGLVLFGILGGTKLVEAVARLARTLGGP
jgi:Mn2+/Fe2+ NRAMP family transporter